MSFEENQQDKGTHGELAGEGLDLPPNMSTLAQRLSDEADWLTRHYPASAPDRLAATATAAATAARQRHSLKRFGLMTGTCAATILVAVIGWQAVRNRDNAVSEGRTPVVEQSSQIAHLNEAGGFGRQVGETIGGDENVLQGLSGAEQEAVLDLIEPHAAHKTSLSI